MEKEKIKSLLGEIQAKVEEAMMACEESYEGEESEESEAPMSKEDYSGDKQMRIKTAAAAIRQGLRK